MIVVSGEHLGDMVLEAQAAQASQGQHHCVERSLRIALSEIRGDSFWK